MTVFSREQEQRIEATIQKVEQSTAAEIVVVTVKRSASYPEVRIGAASVLAFLVAALVHTLWPSLTAGWLLLLQLVVAPLGFFVGASPVLLRQLVPESHAQRAVEQRAQVAFLEHAVFRTRDRTGVLIFVSELEREVAMLGDEGIHAVLNNAGWTELVVHVTHAMREGRGAEGVSEVIEKLGVTLAEHAPQKSGDQDELENTVRTVEERGQHIGGPRITREL